MSNYRWLVFDGIMNSYVLYLAKYFRICVFLTFILCVDSCMVANCNDDAIAIGSNMKFHLHTRYYYKEFNFANIDELNFSPERITKILVHGWKNKVGSSFNTMLLDSYLKLYDANVLIVEWTNYGDCNIYETSKKNVPAVGKAVAFLLDELNQKFGLRPSRTHMIGFSLGAHVAGIAGKLSKIEKLYRITGLDPAGPGFSPGDEDRLKNDTARFVDVIHTGKWAAGTMHRVGLVDFYPNGGMTSFNVIKSHQKAYKFFNESILTPKGFLGKRCDSWSQFKKNECSYDQIAEMGEHISVEARGKFYLQTNDHYPYARFNLSLTYLSDYDRLPIFHGVFFVIFLGLLILGVFHLALYCNMALLTIKNCRGKKSGNQEHQRNNQNLI